MGLSRQEYWSGLPCPLPGDLPDSGIKPVPSASPALQADSLSTDPLGKPKFTYILYFFKKSCEAQYVLREFDRHGKQASVMLGTLE